MREKIYISRPNHTDLNMYRCGMEDCPPSHSWGPGVRDHFLIHYILNGKGIFQINDTTYHLEKGHGFLITPNTITSYQADQDDPWSYSWVGFHGLKAESYLKQANLTAESPIFKYDRDDFIKNCFYDMIAAKDAVRSKEIEMLGCLYLFFARLIEVSEVGQNPSFNESKKEIYIKKAVEYIETNYFTKLSITEMSRHLGLDRSYIYSLFKEYLNTSPQKFLINLRVDKASELLNNKELTIGDISRSVGYDDPLLFSKVFKKIKGLSPREYRKNKISQL